jgi:hypothetical protein
LFNYNKLLNKWDIEISEWHSPTGSRIDSQRQLTTKALQQKFTSELKDVIENILKIQFQSFKYYFQE